MNHRHRHIKPRIHQLRKKKRFFQRPVFWIALLAAAGSGAAIYFYFFFPNVQVLYVQVSGNESLESRDIEAAAWASIKKNILSADSASIFAVSKQELRARVLAEFPSLSEVSVVKQFFNGIVLQVTERVPIGVFCGNQQECFFIDSNGVVFDSIAVVSQDVMVLRGAATAAAGQMAVEKHIVEGILAIEDSLRNNFQIEVKEVMMSNPLIIKTSERWQMYVNPGADINLQISKMNALLTAEITPAARKKLQYIYLQYKDRAYYK